MYISGFTQGMMWKQFTEEGTLQYANFLDTTLQLLPMHLMRAIGGTLYLTGAILMAYNLFRISAILHGITKRAMDGNANANDAIENGAKAGALADLGWACAQ
jgi:cytochrome c oxidase cbb3-type subunit I/II